jgi:type II secretory pathway pseudopilin PulG
MRRLMLVLSVGAVVAMVVAIYAAPAIAQTKKEQRQAAREANRAANRAQASANAGMAVPPDATVTKSGSQEAEITDKSGKALPQSGGGSVGSLLGLSAGALLIGGGVLAYKSARRR